MSQQCEPFVLSTKEDLSSIFSPLKTTQRIKYTCFNVSQNFLILGATSGGLYVFKREPCSFLQLLPNKEGAVTYICISPDESLFAFATVKGTVCVLERNVGPGARLVQISREHLNAQVTEMIWNSQSNELYIGDNVGNISVINILKFMAKNMFNTPTFNLMELDSKIVQLDWFGSLLLVSTMTRCYLCNTFKEEYRQIGQKLRDGEFGACFMNVGDEKLPQRSMIQERKGKFNRLGYGETLSDSECLKEVKIFCARPSSRVWEVGVDGTVENTHEFKQALAVAPTSLIDLKSSCHNAQSKEWSPQSFNFIKLHILSKKYLFTYKSDGIYIFDPEKACLVLWSDDFNDIIDCRVLNDVIYIRQSSGKMHVIAFSSIEKHLIGLYLRKSYDLCAELCFLHQQYLINQISSYPKLHLLIDLEAKVLDNSAVLKISPFLQILSKYYKEKQTFQKLKSGIFRIGNMHSLLNDVDKSEELVTSTVSYNNGPDSQRSRSLSVSYERKPWTRLRKSKSCTSLSETKLNTRFLFERKQFVSSPESENNCNGHSSTDDDFFNSEFLLPFASITTPEAIQAIKHISHSVTGKITSSTKTLKEKWQVLEGKVKHLTHEVPHEPFDVQILNLEESQNVRHNYVCEINNVIDKDIVHMKSTTKKVPYPMLDTSRVSQLCVRLDNSKRNGENCTQLTIDLFNSISTIYDNLITHADSRTKNSDSHSRPNFFTSAKAFPFMHYFPDCVKIIREAFHDSWKTKLLVTWLESVPPPTCINQPRIPLHLSTVHTQYSIDVDFLLSNILIVFTELLNSDTIINCIKSLEVPCYYLSLCAIIEMYEKGALNVPTNSDTSMRSLPVLLNAMYCILRMGHAETCSKMGETINLKDVFYLILRLQFELEDSGIEPNRALKECQVQFLTYVDNIHDSNAVMMALKDEELGPYIFNAFECLNVASNQACLCGFPFSKNCRSIGTSNFSNIGEIICQMYWVADQKQLIQLAGKITGLWRHILNYRKDENTSTLLPLLIHVGDVMSFERRLLSFDADRWEEMLKLFVTYRAGICLNCGRENVAELTGLSWTDVGMLMVKSLGAPVAIQMLLGYESQIPSGELDSSYKLGLELSVEFYQLGYGSYYAKHEQNCVHGLKSMIAVDASTAVKWLRRNHNKSLRC